MRRATPTLILAALVLACAPVRASGAALITASAYEYVPGGTGQPPARMIEGNTLFFLNLDPLGSHTVTARAIGPGAEPIFETDDQVNFSGIVPVRGAELLEPGSYAFYCVTHHPIMQGILEVAPAP